jgi:hypothetical protein
MEMFNSTPRPIYPRSGTTASIAKEAEWGQPFWKILENRRSLALAI